MRHAVFATLTMMLSLALALPDARARDEGYMQAGEIRRTIADARILLQFPLGEFPLTYRSDGTVTGDGRKFGLGRFLAPRETGRWWLEGNSLCQQWSTWYEGRVFCFKLQKLDEDTLRWLRDDGRVGRARIIPLDS